jgi:hypothetical protein
MHELLTPVRIEFLRVEDSVQKWKEVAVWQVLLLALSNFGIHPLNEQIKAEAG